LTRTTAWRLAQAAIVVAVLWFVARYIGEQWVEFSALWRTLEPNYALLAASALVVLASYVVLIWTWQHTVRAWGERLGFRDAARIWFVSNLGRYVPGKVWQIGAMGMLAQRVGVSPVAAVGSSLVVTIVNVLAGAAVAAVASAGNVDAPAWALPATIALACGVIAAPWLLPVVVRTASAVLRRELRVPSLPHSAIWIAALGCTAAWVMYGVAFRWMHIALIGHATGTLAGSTAAFTASYLVGFLVLLAPGGIGVREYALIPMLGRFGIATGGEALLIVLGSRFWLTILEVLPGVLFLLFRRGPTVPTSASSE
jgi:hypothetical protein